MAKQNSNNNGYPISLKDFQRVVKHGIRRVESDNRYHLINDKRQNGKSPTYALGAYQFVPSHHWDKIVAFANSDPRFKGKVNLRNLDFSKNWKNNTKEHKAEFQKFLNNRELQDAFMDKYVADRYDLTMKAWKAGGERWNVNPFQVYAQIHHQGEKDIVNKIKNGVINYKSPDGTSGDAYLKKFNTGINNYLGIKMVKGKDGKLSYTGNAKQRNEAIIQLAKNPTNEKFKDARNVVVKSSSANDAYQNYKSTLKELDKKLLSGQIDNDQYRKEYKNLLDSNKSYINDINSLINKDNLNLRQQKANIINNSRNAINIFNKADFKVKRGSDGELGDVKAPHSKAYTSNGVVIQKSDLTPEELKYVEKNNIFAKSQSGEAYYIKDYKGFNKLVSDAYQVAGKSKFSVFHEKNGKVYLNQMFKVNNDNTSLFDVSTWNPNYKNGKLSTKLDVKLLNNINYSDINNGIPLASYEGLDSVSYDDEEIDNPYVGLENYDTTQTSNTNTNTSSTPDKTGNEVMDKLVEYQIKQQEKADAEKAEEKRLKEEEQISDFLFDNLNKDIVKEDRFAYDKDNYKQDIPITDLANSLAGIAIGQDMQDTDYSPRDEKVNEAYLSWANEMAEISKRGLSIEDEAAAKNAINQAYASGIEQITRASGGNRNVVLGNLGRLDAQKNDALLNLSVEDAKMKMEGLKAYGEASRYISEFDAQRDIANNEREFNIAMERRRNGGDLTASAWSNLSSTLNNMDANKPGSVNHMMKTQFLVNAYGYDPNIKDDGTGTIKNSKSEFMKKQGKLVKQEALQKALYSRTQGMDAQEKKLMSKYLTQTGFEDLNSGIAFADYINQNKGNIDFDKIDNPTQYYADNVLNGVIPDLNNFNKVDDVPLTNNEPQQSVKPNPTGLNFDEILNPTNNNQTPIQNWTQSQIKNQLPNFENNQNNPNTTVDWKSAVELVTNLYNK